MKEFSVDLKSLRELTTKLTENGYLIDRAAQWEYAFDAVNDLVMIVNPNLKIKFINNAFSRRLGLSKIDALDKSCYDVISCPNCKRSPGDCFVNYGQTPKVVSNEDVYIDDNIDGWFNFSHSPIFDDEENLLGFICTLHDVTERKETDEKLKKSEESYRYLVKHAPSGIYEIDFINNKFVVVNDVMCIKSGYTREELLNEVGPFDILSPQSAELYKDRLVKLSKGEEVPNIFEFEIVRKDGKILWASINVKYKQDDDGNIVGATVVSHDITERKEMEQALAESEKKYKNLFKSIKDSILIVDINRNILNFNAAFASTFGYELDDLKGKSTLHIHENKETFEAFGEALKENFGNSGFLKTTNYRKRNGDVFPGETGTYYFKDDTGETTGYIGVIRDVTKRRRIEAELIKSEEKYRNLHDTMPLAALIYGQDFKVLEWNQGAEKMFGWTKEDILGKDFFDFIILDKDKEELGKLANQLRMGDLPVINNINENKTKDGNTIICEWFNSVYHNCKGRTVGVVSLAMDVTSKQLTENKLRENEALMKSIFRATPAGIGLINTSRVINWTNAKLREMTGYSEEDLTGQEMRILYPNDEEYNHVLEDKYRQIDEKGVGTIETIWKRKDDKLIKILLSASPIDPSDLSRGITFTALELDKNSEK